MKEINEWSLQGEVQLTLVAFNNYVDVGVGRWSVKCLTYKVNDLFLFT